MNVRTIRIIWVKELVDISRDRRALVFMVVLPILIVPMLMLGMGRLMAFGKRRLIEEASRVAIIGSAGSPKVAQAIRTLEGAGAFGRAPPEVLAAIVEEAELEGDPESGGLEIFNIVEPPADDHAARALIKEKKLDAVAVIPPGFDDAVVAEKPARIVIIYDSSVDRSKLAHRKVAGVLRALERDLVRDRLQRHSIDKATLEAMTVVGSSVASKEDEIRATLALILPYMFILMCFSGAVYPAIDLGAGEKERGTLETLLVSPAERSEIVLGKFLVIFSTSLLAALLNIGSLAFSFRSGMFPGLLAKFPISINPWDAGLAFVLMLPMAAIFASVLLSISIFAKSFKEAQAYFAPANILIIVPAFFSAIPGVELTVPLALVPIVNVSIAIKETLNGTHKWGCLALILASTLVLAAGCVAFCSRWFEREEVLFRS